VGVIPFVTAKDVIAPEYRILLAPEAATPTEKYVQVEEPPVQAGKVTAAALAACVGAVPEMVQPPEDLATATRA
jgi:hypothetical protein